MTRTFIAKGRLAVLLVTALAACSTKSKQSQVGGFGSSLIGGVFDPSPTPTFNLVAAPNVISTSDGDSMFMWLYGTTAASVQYPGPTLIVNQGAVVTINLSNTLPVATSLVFPGHSVTATGGAGSAPGLLTQEVLPSAGGSVSYRFTADHPGTYMYHSGTRPDLQVEMGLVGVVATQLWHQMYIDGSLADVRGFSR